MPHLFGTDGIRGTANLPPLTPDGAAAIGRAIARTVCPKRARAVLGRDTRRSGSMLEAAVAAGIASTGTDVLLAGVVPTPAVALLTRQLRAAVGVVISASHNPWQDNGIKVFDGHGFKIPARTEAKIESLLTDISNRESTKSTDTIGTVQTIPDAAERYVRFCEQQRRPAAKSGRGIRVVLDCAHGATSDVAPAVFRALGCTVHVMHATPDGFNINRGCGSEHPASLSRTVRRLRADMGFAFDGDGDRLVVVDEQGRILTGDHTLAICAAALKQRRRLAQNLLVTTPMSNMGLTIAMKTIGVKVIEADVGDRNVLNRMRSRGAVLGGEQSGHVILLEHHTTGDGLITAMQILDIVLDTRRTLSDLSGILRVFPQELINVPVKRKPPLADVPRVAQALRGAKTELGDGRILLRYSGTQAMCRVMVEGPARDQVQRIARQIAEAVRLSIG